MLVNELGKVGAGVPSCTPVGDRVDVSEVRRHCTTYHLAIYAILYLAISGWGGWGFQSLSLRNIPGLPQSRVAPASS